MENLIYPFLNTYLRLHSKGKLKPFSVCVFPHLVSPRTYAAVVFPVPPHLRTPTPTK